MLVISFGVPFDGSSSVGLQAVFAAFPWSLLAKGLADLSDATAGESSLISGWMAGYYVQFGLGYQIFPDHVLLLGSGLLCGMLHLVC